MNTIIIMFSSLQGLLFLSVTNQRYGHRDESIYDLIRLLRST
jgi:hypothetical protein